MDGFRQKAQEIFKVKQAFNSTSPTCFTMDIYSYRGYGTKTESRGTPLRELMQWENRSSLKGTGQNAYASLKLLRIGQSDLPGLDIPKKLFLDIFESFQIETYILYLIAQNIDGFHSLEKRCPHYNELESLSFLLNVRGYIWLRGHISGNSP
jgi:hypothetical protein